MLESIYEVLFFSSFRIGNVFVDLILPLVLAIVIYDVILRYLATRVFYWQIFSFTVKNILLNMLARIILLYTFVFIIVGIYHLGILLEDYWLLIVFMIGLIIIISAMSAMRLYTPKKKQQPSVTKMMDQAERFRQYRK